MDYLPPLPVALPFSMAALLMATSSLLPRRVRDGMAIVTSAGVAVICGRLLARASNGPIVYWFGGWGPHDGVALGIGFVIDSFGAGLALLTAILVTVALLYSWRYFDEVGALYPALMLVFLGAMAGFCLTGDLFNLFVFFELMSVAAYSLTAYKIEENQAVMGAFNFAITNSVGAFLVLTGIVLLYGRTGALNLAQLGATLSEGSADGLVLTALTLITCGFGVKAALVPFQFWLADAHAVAPTPVCSLFSGVMVELGLFAVARVYWTTFAGTLGENGSAVRDVWLGLGTLTALVGGIACIVERHLKRMLAFSTISHTGVFLLGVALLAPQALAGSALYVVGHGLVKASLFLATGILLNRFGSVDENELHGVGRRFRLLGVLFLVGGLALSGLPPFGTWLGKSLLEESASQLGYGWLSAVLLISSALTGGAVLRAAGQVFWGLGPAHDQDAETPEREEKETQENYDRPPAIMFLPALVLLLLALAVGLWPGLSRHTDLAARQFENTKGYAAAVLGGTAGGGQQVTPPATRTPGIVSGLAASLGAIIVAMVTLFPHRVPLQLRLVVGCVGKPVMAVLRGLHSGHVGDYVAWVVVGVAAVGGLLAYSVRN